MAGYSIHPLKTREELDGFIDVCWKAWYEPYCPKIRISMPIFGYTAAAKQQAVAATKDRVWADIQKQKQMDRPVQRYVYARHDASGQIVGGVRLDRYDGSPWPDGCPKLNFDWWPEGEEVREFAQEMMQQMFTPKAMWMQRPHIAMINFVVDPKHRGRGIGLLLMEYHEKELDELDLEGFVEASEHGRPVYEKIGYQVVMKIMSFIPAGKSEDWKRWHHEFGCMPIYMMWRPKNGKVAPGERSKPWQQGPVLPIE